MLIDNSGYSKYVKGLIAEETNDPNLLEVLSKEEGICVRRKVAFNPNTSPEVLDSLANDEEYCVRIEVAWNPNTLPETLKILASDEVSYVRYHVARNPNTPQYILTYLKLRNFYTSCTK